MRFEMFDLFSILGHKIGAFVFFVVALSSFGVAFAVATQTPLAGHAVNPASIQFGTVAFFFVGIAALLAAWREIRIANVIAREREIKRAKRKHEEMLVDFYGNNDR